MVRHPPIFLCPSVIFVSIGKNHLLVVISNKVTPIFYFFYLLISIYLLKSSVAGEGYSETLISKASSQKFSPRFARRRDSSIPLQDFQQFSLVLGFV